MLLNNVVIYYFNSLQYFVYIFISIQSLCVDDIIIVIVVIANAVMWRLIFGRLQHIDGCACGASSLQSVIIKRFTCQLSTSIAVRLDTSSVYCNTITNTVSEVHALKTVDNRLTSEILCFDSY
jgi:hypothetical protein